MPEKQPIRLSQDKTSKQIQKGATSPAEATGHLAWDEAEDASLAALGAGADHGQHVAADPGDRVQLHVPPGSGRQFAQGCRRPAAAGKRDRARSKKAGSSHAEWNEWRIGNAAQGTAIAQPAHPALIMQSLDRQLSLYSEWLATRREDVLRLDNSACSLRTVQRLFSEGLVC